MNKTQQNEEAYSIYDKLESARFSSQEFNDKFLELQKMLLKIKKKNVKKNHNNKLFI